ncbi:retrovirus-related Pol polyprotein from type-1 retrotransposable element R1 [Trichonephila inaurata madagascariensis]|uniref:Retrovirus-related Pol polyprotein from type-1 retrotransposable element R1 n=1 Tax=Trichonephila inaurata madagascariensis TaxID=2747483 RepID=A0A8X6YVX9_9ARAC|nr:retrovirus-related Pol polyprotein from type-1 retrotransposable element R1 [Trichonephila inaurata madagascariensis]
MTPPVENWEIFLWVKITTRFTNYTDDQEFRDDNETRDSFDVPFMDPFENLEDTSHDLFQRMDDMLNRMFSASFAAMESDNFDEFVQTETNPRAMMLKEPDCSSCNHSPVNIDDKVAKHKWLLKESPFNHGQQNFSFSRFSSVKTIRLPDGTLEEHRSVTDNHGNTVTSVHRAIGDQSHEVTTQIDEKGLKEKLEKFTNMDENDLQSFEEKWQNIRKGSGPIPIHDQKSNALEPKLKLPAGDPSYLSLFKKFFGF